jgi:hypothetical protein
VTDRSAVENDTLDEPLSAFERERGVRMMAQVTALIGVDLVTNDTVTW